MGQREPCPEKGYEKHSIEKKPETNIVVEDTTVYDFPDSIASYGDSQSDFITYIGKNLKIIGNKISTGISPCSQKHFFSFIIEKDGSLSNIKCVRGECNHIIDQTVIILEKMPPWKPAKNKNGCVVRSKFIIPVYINLN